MGAAMKAATMPVMTPASEDVGGRQVAPAHQQHDQADRGADHQQHGHPAEDDEGRLVRWRRQHLAPSAPTDQARSASTAMSATAPSETAPPTMQLPARGVRTRSQPAPARERAGQQADHHRHHREGHREGAPERRRREVRPDDVGEEAGGGTGQRPGQRGHQDGADRVEVDGDLERAGHGRAEHDVEGHGHRHEHQRAGVELARDGVEAPRLSVLDERVGGHARGDGHDHHQREGVERLVELEPAERGQADQGDEREHEPARPRPAATSCDTCTSRPEPFHRPARQSATKRALGLCAPRLLYRGSTTPAVSRDRIAPVLRSIAAIITPLLLIGPLLAAELGTRALIRAGRLPEAPSSDLEADVALSNIMRLGRPDIMVLGTSVIRSGLRPSVLEASIFEAIGRKVTVRTVAQPALSLQGQRILVDGLARKGLVPSLVILGLTTSLMTGYGAPGDWFPRSELGRLWGGCRETDGPAWLSCALSQRSALWRWRGDVARHQAGPPG